MSAQAFPLQWPDGAGALAIGKAAALFPVQDHARPIAPEAALGRPSAISCPRSVRALNPNFISAALRVERSSKAHLEIKIADVLGRAHLRAHAEGGEKPSSPSAVEAASGHPSSPLDRSIRACSHKSRCIG